MNLQAVNIRKYDSSRQIAQNRVLSYLALYKRKSFETFWHGNELSKRCIFPCVTIYVWEGEGTKLQLH